MALNLEDKKALVAEVSAVAATALSVVAAEYRRLSRRLLMAALVATMVVIAVPTVQDRILPTSNNVATGGTAYSSLSWRINNWQGLLGQWEQSPIIGFGLRSTDTVNPEKAYTAGDPTGSGFDAHNSVVRALVDGTNKKIVPLRSA